MIIIIFIPFTQFNFDAWRARAARTHMHIYVEEWMKNFVKWCDENNDNTYVIYITVLLLCNRTGVGVAGRREWRMKKKRKKNQQQQ